MKKPEFLKSKEEKALERRIALKRTIQQMKKFDKSLEHKKDQMIKHAQEAKKQGVKQQYNMAVSGLKMILAHQKRARAMQLQLEMTETMRDLTTMSSDFVKTLGAVGQEMGDLVAHTDFIKNQAAFEMGMAKVDAAMEQLEGFMEDTGDGFEEMTEDEMTSEVERLIDVTGAVATDPVDDEIDRRLAELSRKREGLKE